MYIALTLTYTRKSATQCLGTFGGGGHGDMLSDYIGLYHTLLALLTLCCASLCGAARESSEAITVQFAALAPQPARVGRACVSRSQADRMEERDTTVDGETRDTSVDGRGRGRVKYVEITRCDMRPTTVLICTVRYDAYCTESLHTPVAFGYKGSERKYPPTNFSPREHAHAWTDGPPPATFTVS